MKERDWRAASAAACVIGIAACSTARGFDDADRLVCAVPERAAVTAALPSSALRNLSNGELEKIAASGERTSRSLAAARVLGERYEEGSAIVAQDIGKAVGWYRAAALVKPETHFVYMPGFRDVPGSVIAVGGSGPITPGDPIAMRRLGEMFRAGIGVKVNSERANALLSCAAKYDSQRIVLGNGAHTRIAMGFVTARVVKICEMCVTENLRCECMRATCHPSSYAIRIRQRAVEGTCAVGPRGWGVLHSHLKRSTGLSL